MKISTPELYELYKKNPAKYADALLKSEHEKDDERGRTRRQWRFYAVGVVIDARRDGVAKMLEQWRNNATPDEIRKDWLFNGDMLESLTIYDTMTGKYHEIVKPCYEMIESVEDLKA